MAACHMGARSLQHLGEPGRFRLEPVLLNRVPGAPRPTRTLINGLDSGEERVDKIGRWVI